MDCLIAGSSALCSVYLGSSWKPNDIDIYMKNINYDKIKLFDQAVRESSQLHCSGSQVILIRKCFTLNWIIFHENIVITKVQLNLLNVKSWAEIFACYHSDLVCIGYEIKETRFVCLKDRWIRFCSNLDKNEPIFFTNAINFDNEQTLISAAKKYMNRSFNVYYIVSGRNDIITENHNNCFNVGYISSKHNGMITEYNNNYLNVSGAQIIDEESSIYGELKSISNNYNISMSHQVDDLIYQDETHPDYVNIRNILILNKFFCLTPTMQKRIMIRKNLSDCILTSNSDSLCNITLILQTRQYIMFTMLYLSEYGIIHIDDKCSYFGDKCSYFGDNVFSFNQLVCRRHIYYFMALRLHFPKCLVKHIMSFMYQ